MSFPYLMIIHIQKNKRQNNRAYFSISIIKTVLLNCSVYVEITTGSTATVYTEGLRPFDLINKRI